MEAGIEFLSGNDVYRYYSEPAWICAPQDWAKQCAKLSQSGSESAAPFVVTISGCKGGFIVYGSPLSVVTVCGQHPPPDFGLGCARKFVVLVVIATLYQNQMLHY